MLHLDLDAFFASVEQRDKPSLRGKPVVVGGVGQRGVVATASYEARVFGVRSAMPAHEARRRCPNAAFLSTRFGAYRIASDQVMGILRELSPVIEPLSLDEAFVDLRAATRELDFSPAGLQTLVAELKAAVTAATGGLTASVGVGSSKFIAKVASELGKPDGGYIVEVGTEVALLAPMSVSVIPGVGPVTAEKLQRIGIRTVADLQGISPDELAQQIGRSHAQALVELAYARDDRPVEAERETKSISVEDTFETNVADAARARGDPAPRRAPGGQPAHRSGPVRPHGIDQGAAARLLDLHPVAHPADRNGPVRGDRDGRHLPAVGGQRGGRRTPARRRRGWVDRCAAGGPVRRGHRGGRGPDRRCRRSGGEPTPRPARSGGPDWMSRTTSTAAAGSGGPVWAG